MENKPIPRPKTGRPTRRTPETAATLVKAISRGIPIKHACALARVSFETFRKWRMEDEAFQNQLEEAAAEGVEKHMARIEKAAENGDWRASSWFLEHTQPEHFSKSRVQVEHIGAVAHSFAIPQETIDQIAAARAKYEAEPTTGAETIQDPPDETKA